jgi:hypothetical protein
MNEREPRFSPASPSAEQNEQREKPSRLYHASPFTRTKEVITEFQPRPSRRDQAEGDVVFAANDKAGATMFLVESDDSWTQKSKFDDVYCEVIGDEQRWREADKGGRIYSLPGDNFSCDISKGWGKCEWVNPNPVQPIQEETEEYDSALKAMISHGVQVFMVDQDTFKQIRESEDHGLAILQKATSENQKLGEKVLPLEDKC